MQNQVSKRFIGRRAAAVVAAGLIGTGALAPVAGAQQAHPVDERVKGMLVPALWFPKEVGDAAMKDLKEGETITFIEAKRSGYDIPTTTKDAGATPEYLLKVVGIDLEEGETVTEVGKQLAEQKKRDFYGQEVPEYFSMLLVRKEGSQEVRAVPIVYHEFGAYQEDPYTSYAVNKVCVEDWDINTGVISCYNPCEFNFGGGSGSFSRGGGGFSVRRFDRESTTEGADDTSSGFGFSAYEERPSAGAFSGGGGGGGIGGYPIRTPQPKPPVDEPVNGDGDSPEDGSVTFGPPSCATTVAPTGSLSGTVVWDMDISHNVTEGDERIQGAEVVITRNGEEVARTKTDKDGAFRVERLVGGYYDISVTDPDGGTLLFSDEDAEVTVGEEDTGNDWGFLKGPEPTTVTEVTTTTETTTVTPPAKTTTLPPETVTTTVENPPVTVTSTPERVTDTVTETPKPSTTTVTKTPEKETVTKTPEKVTETATVTKTPEKETVTKTPEVKTVTATPPTVTVTPEKVTETVTLPPKTVTQKEPAVTVTKAPETETVTAAPDKVTETVTVTPPEPAPELGGFTGTVVWDNDGSKSASDGDERISGLTVIAKRDGKEIARTTTDENGFYTFEGLAPGDYAIEVVGPDGARLGFEDRKASVKPGETDSGNDWGFVREDAPAPAPEEKPATPVETVRMTLATTGANSYALAGLGAVLAALVALAVVSRRKTASQ